MQTGGGRVLQDHPRDIPPSDLILSGRCVQTRFDCIVAAGFFDTASRDIGDSAGHSSVFRQRVSSGMSLMPCGIPARRLQKTQECPNTALLLKSRQSSCMLTAENSRSTMTHENGNIDEKAQ